MKLAVIRIRGIRNIQPRIKKTLELLRLEKPNHCVVIDDSPQNIGMLNIVKDYVTYGSIEEETLYKLLYKRGKKGATLLRNVSSESDIKKAATAIAKGDKTIAFANPVFRLTPPSKGFKGIRQPYPEGELGKRDEIDSLLRKMM